MSMFGWALAGWLTAIAMEFVFGFLWLSERGKRIRRERPERIKQEGEQR